MTVEIYALRDPSDGSLCYIGKANNASKRLQTHMRDSRRRDTPVYRWIRDIGVPALEVLARVPDDCWIQAEREAIVKARSEGANLLNVAKGGNEPYCPAEVRAANGRTVAASRNRRLWALRRDLGMALRLGHVREATKARMRERPDVFGQFARWL